MRDYSDVNPKAQNDPLSSNYEAEFNQFVKEEEASELSEDRDDDSDTDADQLVQEEMQKVSGFTFAG